MHLRATMNEFLTRIYSGILFLGVFCGIFYFDINLFNLLIFVVLLVALYEFYNLVPLRGFKFFIASLIYPILPFTFVFLLNTLEFRSILIIYFIMTSAFDTSCYIFGKLLGKHKICPVSPNKSWEGFIGGVITLVFYLKIYFNHISTLSLFLFSFVFGFLALTGDLFESWLKRRAGVKDSGKLLPGHGGVLDRFDTLTFTLPLVYLLRYYLITKWKF